MFGKMRFFTRVASLPILAAAAFLLVAAATGLMNARSSARLERLEESLYPRLLLFFELQLQLKEINRDFRDAVSLQSLDALDNVAERRLTLTEKLERSDWDKKSAFESLFERYFRSAEQTARKLIAGDTGSSQSDIESMNNAFDDVERFLSEAVTTGRDEVATVLSETRSAQALSLVVSLSIAFATLVLLGWLSKGVIGAVGILADKVTDGMTKINSASAEVLAASRQQERSTSQQASAIEETRRTVESLADSSRAIAAQAESVSINARQTHETNQEIAEKNRDLTERLEGISSILESVKDIANKSELLALNAALEGTKAGEAGRGFSLVAVQMQRLAENVMGNVEDIKRLTREVREASHKAVLAIEEGTRLARDTTSTAERIRLVTQQQESATRQVTESMRDASMQVQQSAASVRQSSDAVESLVELAAQINRLLVELRLDRSSG